jgi:cytochrome P450 family 114
VATVIETGDATADDVIAKIVAIGQPDPYPYFTWLREHAPVVYSSHFRAYMLSRHADCERVLKSPADFRSIEQDTLHELFPQAGEHEAYRILFTSLVNTNPPTHTRLRRLVNRAFSPRRINDMHDRISEICTDLLDQVDDDLRSGSDVDLHRRISVPLPLRVLALLLGVPDDDYRRLADLVPRMLHIMEANPSAEALAGADAAFGEFGEYLDALIAARRDEPTDDLVSALVRAGADGDRLTTDELKTTVITLWAAGFETPAITIDCGVMLLITRPELRSWMADEESALRFTDEVLRWDTPGQISTGRRYSVNDVEIAGVAIPAGAQVRLLLGSANRDPEAYDDPDTFNPGRTGPAAIAFGAGPHYCIGAGLARLQMAILLPELFRRYPTLTLATPPRRRRSMPLRDFASITVRVGNPAG